MTWLTTFYLRAFAVLLQVALIYSDENGPMPGFKQQPTDTLAESKNITILCDVKGQKPYRITWLRNDYPLDLTLSYITISTEGSLNIFNAQPMRDQGRYRCIIRNTFGTALSREAELTFPSLEQVAKPTRRINAYKGNPVMLPCNPPKSNPLATIRWNKKHSYRLSEKQGNSHHTTSLAGDLYFAYTSTSDHGTYRCVIENSSLKEFETREIVLAIRNTSPKSIKPNVELFESKLVMKDSHFVLECISSGRPIPKMKFIHIRTGKALTNAKQEANRLRISFGKFTAEHVGGYYCQVEQNGVINEKRAFLDITAKPEVHSQVQMKNIDVGSHLELPCVASGVPAPRYDWYRNGTKLPTNVFSARYKIFNGNLTINDVQGTDAGVYQCAATNNYGEDIMTVYVKVFEYKATFEKKEVDKRAVIGNSKDLMCSPKGAPKPKVEWKKKISNSQYQMIKDDENIKLLSTGALRIKRVKEKDAGTYVCLASNKLGHDEQITTLKVESSLLITQKLSEDEKVLVGSTITMTCRIEKGANIEVTIRWKKGRSNKFLKNSRVTQKDNPDHTLSIITINKAEQSDSGKYICIASSSKATATEVQHLYIVGPKEHRGMSGISTTAIAFTGTTKFIPRDRPDPPHILPLDNKNISTNVEVKWYMQKDNGDKASKVYIQVKTKFEGSEWTTIKISNKTGSDIERETIKLSPWVSYKIRLLAENIYGISEPSPETDKWIRTPMARPTKYPQNITGVGLNPNELKISFDLLPEIDQNAPGISYIVYHRETNGTYDMVSNNIKNGQNFILLRFGNMDSYYTQYEFQVQAQNDVGVGPKSPIYTAYTGEMRPTFPPQNLTVVISSTTSVPTAVATWNNIPTYRTLLRGQLKGYKFFYREKSKSLNSERGKYVITKKNSISVRLKPYTEYYFSVLAYNNADDGPLSEEIGPLRTPEGEPSRPVNFVIAEATNTYVKLTWEKPLYPRGELIKYILTYQTPGGTETLEEINIEQTTRVLRDLSPIKLYFFKLSAVTNAGEGKYTEVKFDFSKVPTMKLEKPNVASVGHDAVVLTWSPVSGVKITGYKIFYWMKGAPEDVSAVWEERNDIVTTIKSLLEATTYYFQIAVENEYGIGPRSNVAIARTKMKNTEKPDRNEPVPTEKSRSRSNKLKITNYVIILLTLVAILVPR